MVSVDRLQGISGDLGVKCPVRVATTANITLSGLQTIDGITVVSGDRVLVKDQTNAADNGIWNATTSSWSRALDFDAENDAVAGTLVVVSEGTVNGGMIFRVSNTGSITIGTTLLTWANAFLSTFFAAVGSSLIGHQPTAGAATTVQLELRSHEAKLTGSIAPVGAAGDGVADDTDEIQAALTGADGKSLDLQGKTYLISSPVSASFTLPTVIKNGSIAFSAASSGEFALKIRTTSNLTVENLSVDGNSKTAKLLHIHPNAAASRIYVDNFSGKNALQTDLITSVAAGLQISPEVETDVFALAAITDSSCTDIASTKTASPIGRGIYVMGAVHTFVDGCTIERVGPYQDGDGVFVSADSLDADGCSATITNSVFVDCAKRSIKSQVVRTAVSSVQFTRTQSFADAGTGQCEIGLQYGGSLDGALVTYADGAAPRCVVALSYFAGIGVKAVPGTVRNITIKCADPADVIPYLLEMSMNNAGGDLYSPLFENIYCNAFVKNVLYCYNTDSTLAARTINGVQLRNIFFSGFSASAEAAYVFMTRGSSSNFTVNAVMHGVVSSANSAAIAYLDPTPGSTAFLSFVLTECSHVKLLAGSETSANSSPVKVHRFFVAENANLTKTFTLLGNAASVRVSASFTSNRDAAASKLFTEGIIQSAGSKTYYRELIAGAKTDANSGTIAIAGDAAANSFTVSHTAGALTATGTLLITVEDLGFIQSVA